jgi:superfamily II DNA or RNA helicase
MVVRGKELVDNASKRLFREGVAHGCLQANHWNKNPHAAVQVCSIDTLYARKIAPPADLVVIDEAHFAVSPSFRWLVDQYPDAYFLPVTATPHVKEGLRHIAEEVVYPITINDLIEQGYLSAPKYFAPSAVDLSTVKIDRTTGDYKTNELADTMMKNVIVGDIVRHYRKHVGDGAAVLFACSVPHSIMIRDQLRSAGIAAEHIEANTSADERERVLADLEAGKCKVVCNVGILCTGVDMPYLRAVIMVRPTKSYNLFIQQIGRGTRRHEDKDFFVVLDHANNIAEHGFIENEKICDLDGIGKPRGEEKPIRCEECFCVWMTKQADGSRDYICPDCGHDNRPKRMEAQLVVARQVDSVEWTLVEVSSQDVNREIARYRAVSDVIRQAQENVRNQPGKNFQGWAYYKISERFGDDYAKRCWARITRDIPKSAQRS